ncbi:pyrimidine-nucleoside phosphorylase [Catenibacillus scindens]|uniref:Pyrimidine-nucleoside phosphorylase n=1 Tax=Catenibacillus scindens TaxID=673271 RepID=A0A7W8M610_9FIRM|nr:pyrimidine-nucleoside phosphorylase [Catenibacillus scindens]MBB5264926.1 pyrimidine-nucleoside phosphorylase [Catenibacillus scindens]
MRFVDTIVKKREGKTLSTEEIREWIRGYVQGQIPDYQVSALLMAIVFQGMDARETYDLTMAMMNSGDLLDLSQIRGVTVDKHSTGGVGDKTTLVVAPMAAACGAKIAKMSGRGLGHTGGTLDKLESIPGFNCFLEKQAFFDQVNRIGLAIAGQTGNLVPADKKLYALRDVTGTVDSMPLIASSIMSKKLASGSSAIVLDVKYGSGAFMKTLEDAVALGREMMDIGRAAGRKVSVIVTDMDEPLGCAIGNALEVKEAIDTLCGRGPEDFTHLCLAVGSLMLVTAGIVRDEKQAQKRLEEVLANGAALEKFKAMVRAQGGDVSVVDDPRRLPKSRMTTELRARQDGCIDHMDAMNLGTLAMQIGAGRRTKDDAIEPETGIVLRAKVGDCVKEGQVLAQVCHNVPLEQEWIHGFYDSISLSGSPGQRRPLIREILTSY